MKHTTNPNRKSRAGGHGMKTIDFYCDEVLNDNQ
jgi:hypothetical protein